MKIFDIYLNKLDSISTRLSDIERTIDKTAELKRARDCLESQLDAYREVQKLRSCKSCKHLNIDILFGPCNCCRDQDKWESKEAPKADRGAVCERRWCFDCKYCRLDVNDEPCVSCSAAHNKWEPKA